VGKFRSKQILEVQSIVADLTIKGISDKLIIQHIFNTMGQTISDRTLHYIESLFKFLRLLKISYSKFSTWNISFLAVIIIVFISLPLASVSLFASGVSGAEPPSISIANATKYKLVNRWGQEGNGDGQFGRPHDLDFSPSEDKLYIIDRDNQRVQVFDKSGKFLFKWGQEGNGNGQFKLPYGLDVDEEGNVWIADRTNNNIQKFDAQGAFLLRFGSNGSKPGQFDNLRGVVVDEALRYVYASDSNNHRIQKFDIKGNFIKSFGILGNDSGLFNVPTTVILDSKGYLYVTERGNERVQKLNTEGNSILMWGSKGSGPNQFCHMEHMAVDKFNNIYVNDPQSDLGCSHEAAIKKFDSNGKFVTKIVIPGVDPDPEHLAIDSDGNVYVSLRGFNEIQVYKPLIEK
jgi:DNA-binding beta-propeller fold protein YncE